MKGKRRMKKERKKIFLLSLDYVNFRTLEELFNKVYIKIENLFRNFKKVIYKRGRIKICQMLRITKPKKTPNGFSLMCFHFKGTFIVMV